MDADLRRHDGTQKGQFCGPLLLVRFLSNGWGPPQFHRTQTHPSHPVVVVVMMVWGDHSENMQHPLQRRNIMRSRWTVRALATLMVWGIPGMANAQDATGYIFLFIIILYQPA